MNEFVSISELTQSSKDKISSKDITDRFLFSLFDSSVTSQIAERVCTLRSLIERRYAIVGWLKNYQKLIVGDGAVGMVGRVRKKQKV